MPLTLCVFPPSPRSFKVLAAAAYLDLEYERRVVDLGKGEQRSAEYLAVNPNGKLPALDHDGFRLFEANAILQYLASLRPERGLLPEDPARRAEVAQWQFWDLAHWEAACAPVLAERCVKPLLGLGEPDEARVRRSLQVYDRVAPVLDGQLGRSRFVAGAEPTVADFSLGAVLNLAEPAGFPLAPYPNLRRWHNELLELPGWRGAMAFPGRS